MQEEQSEPEKIGTASCSKQINAISERELRKRAMKLDLAPMLGKAFRYVTVDKNGECEEVDEQFVRERRESIMRASIAGLPLTKAPMKKLRKARPVSSAPDSTTTQTNIKESYSKPEWLPDSFTITRTTLTHISGWVNSEEELTQVLTSHTDAFSCRYVSWYRGKGFSNSFDPKRIAWKREDIEPDCPFAIDSYLVRHCPYGMRLKRLAEVRDSFKQTERTGDSKPSSMACHARLKIRRVTLYEDFRLNPEDKTKKVMWEKMMYVKQMISRGQQMNTSSRIYLQLPLPAAHKNHTVPLLEEGAKTEINCQDSVKETEVIDTLLSEEQRELSYDTPKLELKDMDETSQSLGGTFGVMDFAVADAETTIDHWKTAQSFIGDTVSSILRSDTQQIKQCDLKQGKNTEEFHFEVRPPQKRTHILSSCKVDCPARIKVKRVSLYESFRLEEGDSRRKKDDKMLMVKDMISNSTGDLLATPAIFMQLPLAAAHRNHQVTVPDEDEVSRATNFEGCHLPSSDLCHQNLQQQQHPLMNWLPQCFIVTTCGIEYVTGWVRTEEEYLQVLEKHKHVFGCSFLAWSNDKERTFKAEADRRVMWKKDFIDPGCPLTVHHSLILACAFSDQSKGKAHASSIQNLAPDLSCLAPEMGKGIIQVPQELVQDGTSLEIQYCDPAHQYPQLQSLMKPNETYIILVENS